MPVEETEIIQRLDRLEAILLHILELIAEDEEPGTDLDGNPLPPIVPSRSL